MGFKVQHQQDNNLFYLWSLSTDLILYIFRMIQKVKYALIYRNEITFCFENIIFFPVVKPC